MTTLPDWLKKKSLTVAEFARRAGLEVSTAHRAATGKVTPSPDTMQAIYRATDGAVTPNDFFEAPSRPFDGGGEEASAADEGKAA